MQKRYDHPFSIIRRFIFFLTLVFLSIPVMSLQASVEEQTELGDLWIDLSIGTPLIEIFNERAMPNDIARVEHISQLELLEDINSGKKLVVFKSAEDAIRLLPHMHDEIDIIGYNLEHGPANPLDEQENPVASIRRLREVADRYDLEVALGPDRRFALSDGPQMAPYADYFILQIQKVQTEPETVYEFAVPLIADIREANPDIEISVQVRTEGDIQEMLSMLAPLHDKIDGISILTSEETIDIAEELIAELRTEAAPVEAVPDTVLPTPIGKSGAPEIHLPESAGSLPELAENPDPIRETSASIETEMNPEIDPAAIAETTLEAVADDRVLSTPEENLRLGSTWLVVIVALAIGFALGAGYVSYRAGS